MFKFKFFLAFCVPLRLTRRYHSCPNVKNYCVEEVQHFLLQSQPTQIIFISCICGTFSSNEEVPELAKLFILVSQGCSLGCQFLFSPCVTRRSCILIKLEQFQLVANLAYLVPPPLTRRLEYFIC